MSNDQKAENLLNLALDTPEAMREKSGQLNVGYDGEEKAWELIVKYYGDLREALRRFPEVLIYELTGGYAILTVPERLVDQVIALPQIEYVEKPKRLYFAVNQGRTASCLTAVQGGAAPAIPPGNGGLSGNGVLTGNDGLTGNGGRTGNAGLTGNGGLSGNDGLTGKGVLVAVIDSGIDYFHEDFRDAGGRTRILKLWDQDRDQIFTEEDINRALAAASREEARRFVNSFDASGHGTAVAAIAAGNGRASGGRYRGVAYESGILAVKLGAPRGDSFPRTTELMKAFDFVAREAADMGRPAAVNLSFGNTYGSHDGRSLLETYIDDISSYGRLTVAIGTGNEGSAGGHEAGILKETETVELSVSSYETGFGVQLWKAYEDQWELTVVGPGGGSTGPLGGRPGPSRLRVGATNILMYYGEPTPYSPAQEIYFDLVPEDRYVDAGIWKFILTPVKIVDGRYDFWLPSAAAVGNSTRFLRPAPDTTLTIPSTAARPVSVGAYDDSTDAYADFSGRGFTRFPGQVKPDLAAPGVNIITAKRGGGYEAVTGTSFAAPFVTGSAALLMEWGIVRGNDPYLYGEKVKAYLRRGARHLPGYETWPNPFLGYGALCVRDSLPGGEGL